MQKHSNLAVNGLLTDSEEVITIPTASSSSYQDYFKDEDSFGTILLRMCQRTFGEDFMDWEADTIALSIDDEFGEIPDTNLDKILSLVSVYNALDGRLSFFNEVNCFRHTVDALNGLEPDYTFLGVLIPQHISWAMYEMKQLYPDRDLAEEPAKFMALSFHKVGSLLLPDDLREYQELLDYYNGKTSVLSKSVEDLWSKNKNIPTSKIDSLDDDDFVYHQVLMLIADRDYMAYKRNKYTRDMLKIQVG